MTQTNSRLIDEIARLATDAAAVAQGARREAETAVRTQIERLLADANVVHRDEFEAVKIIATRAADEADSLRARLDALEARLGGAAEGTPRTETGQTGGASPEPGQAPGRPMEGA